MAKRKKVVDFPDRAADISGLRLPGKLHRLRPELIEGQENKDDGRPFDGAQDRLVYHWRLGELETLLTVEGRKLELPDDAPAELQTILEAQIEEVANPRIKQASRELFRAAESAGGKAIADLSDDEMRALLALLLWDRKGLDKELKVRPPGDWVKRQLKEG